MNYFEQLVSSKTTNSSELRNFIDKYNTSLQAVNLLEIPDLYDYLITSFALSKLHKNYSKNLSFFKTNINNTKVIINL